MDPLKQEIEQLKTPAEIREFLEANAWDTTEEERPYYFDENELIEMKDQLGKDEVVVFKADQKLKAAKDLYKEETKEQKERIKTTVKSLSSGSEIRLQTVYLLDDQEEGKMYIYDERGNLIDKRAILTHERQGRLRPLR